MYCDYWNLVFSHGLMAQARSKDEKTIIISQVQIEGKDFNLNNF